MIKSAYLGGPIAGLTWTECVNWRIQVEELLRPLECKSPLRDFNGVSQTICNGNFNEHVNDHQIVPFEKLFQRDYQDVSLTDMGFFNFIGAKAVSVGSVSEVAWTYEKRKPVVVAMEAGNPNENHFLLWQITKRCYTLKDAVNFARSLAGLPAYDLGD